MYLEISGRRSGKTTRLVNQLAVHLQAGCTPILMVGTGQSRYILELLGHKYGYPVKYEKSVKVVRTLEEYHRILSESRNPFDDTYHKLFVDEFDLIPKEELPITTFGYYVTTPVRMRDLSVLSDIRLEDINDIDDPMIKLIALNDGGYTRHWCAGWKK